MSEYSSALFYIAFCLSCFRLNMLLQEEDGPFEILANMRWFALRFTAVFECPYCLSIWTSGISVLILSVVQPSLTIDCVLWWLSSSALTCILTDISHLLRFDEGDLHD